MPELLLLCEDIGQKSLLEPLIKRVSAESKIEVTLSTASSKGGFSKALSRFLEIKKDIDRNQLARPDGIVFAADANCRTYTKTRNLIDKNAGHLKDILIYAIPDPHIEKWYLSDSHAFKLVFGQGCKAPQDKCEKDRYKKILVESIVQTGKPTLFGGIEYAEQLVENLDLESGSRDTSLNNFISELKSWLNRQKIQYSQKN